MTLAATFFGGINVAADTVGKQALDAQLANTPVDMQLQAFSVDGGKNLNSSVQSLISNLQKIDGVSAAEPIGAANLFNASLSINLKGIQDTSTLYQHMTLVSGRKTLHANETLINSDSQQAQNFPVNRRITYTLYTNSSRKYNVTLTVVGSVSLDAVAVNTLGIGYYYQPFPGNPGPIAGNQQASILIVSWGQTFLPVLAKNYISFSVGNVSRFYSLSAQVNVYLDRNRLISPFAIESSISTIQQVDARISNLAQQYGFSSSDNLLGQLEQFSTTILSLRLTFTAVSIPVFFMAWYVGRTVSQSSFNLRRKEIGLLLTRGFTRSQLVRHFITEGTMVGLLAGLAGISLAYVLNPLFLQVLGSSAGATAILTSDTAIVTIIFTLVLTLFAILTPARQAAAMDPAQALKGYVYLEETRPIRKRGAILALTLGAYQLLTLAIGVNYMNIGRYVYNANFLLVLFLILAAVLSFALSFIGPFLFLYGAAQLSTGLSERFHRKFSSISRWMIGDVAALASKSVFRNPRRVAALVFIVALIVGYSIWIIGDLASQQDYNYRQAEVSVGSDIRLSGINSIANATLVANTLRNWSNITGATAESDFSGTAAAGGIQIKAIDPLTWRQGAYYEANWFTGDINGVFDTMATNNHTMVLDHGVASYYSFPIGTTIILYYRTTNASVISFFGPDYSQSFGGPFGRSFSPEGWSFIPIGLIRPNATLFNPTNFVLVKASPDISLTQLALSLQTAYPYLTITTAQVATQGVAGVINAGTQNVLRLGTAFAALAASIGVGTIAYTGYREREKEITMVAVRGFSYRQLAGLLITEFLPLVIFALILATIVGLVVVWGDALGQNSLNQSYLGMLAARRVVFPLWASANILVIVGLVLAGVFIPAIAAARKDLSKMSRTVRFA
ncbi:MAG TPA: FtsX-like permease family protein [Candidatus Sulfotelmatobacter sp.]|nr:FtsX-like permease family protein [Candidatus Sulfotelmatobacter sp.]